MKIPFSPPDINKNVLLEVEDALKSGWITTGPKVNKLESLVSEYTHAPNVLCVNSATSGLLLALKWFGIEEGDEVIIPAYTYSATALAVMHTGATPVIVDVEKDFNISIEEIRHAITENTKAIIPVDFAGWPCDYEEILELAKTHSNQFVPKNEIQKKLGRILILSDAAHSIGATYKNKPLGAVSDITVFSFHAVKNITTAEGGALCINLPTPFDCQEEYNFLRCFALNGQTKDAFTKSKAGGWKYDIIYPGLKINLPDVLAAIGVAQLPEYFSYTLAKRKSIYEHYNNTFKDKTWSILPPFDNDIKTSSYHLYALRIKGINENTRDRIINKITENDVAVNVHFQPLPLLMLFCADKGYDLDDNPIAYKNYKSEISLPIYPQLSTEELEYISKTVISAIESEL